MRVTSLECNKQSVSSKTRLQRLLFLILPKPPERAYPLAGVHTPAAVVHGGEALEKAGEKVLLPQMETVRGLAVKELGLARSWWLCN